MQSVDRLINLGGLTGISTSQVSRIWRDPDEVVFAVGELRYITALANHVPKMVWRLGTASGRSNPATPPPRAQGTP